MNADLYAPQFSQADALAVSRLSPHNLQAYAARGLIELAEQQPGKGKKRLYSFANILVLDMIRRLGEHPFSVPPGHAALLAEALIKDRWSRTHRYLADFVLYGKSSPDLDPAEFDAVAIIHLDNGQNSFVISPDPSRQMPDIWAALDMTENNGVVSLIAVDKIHWEVFAALHARKIKPVKPARDA